MVAEFIQTNIHLQDDEYYYGPCRHVSYRKLAIVRVINVCPSVAWDIDMLVGN